MAESWPLISSSTVLDVGFFKVGKDTSVSPRTGEEMDFYIIHTPDWVQVVPLTRDGRLVMIRQYRHGSRSSGLEIPGGLIDAGDASPRDAALRELEEETGYGGGNIVDLGDLHPQPALLSNRAWYFVAKDVEYRTPPQLDRGEDIEVVLTDPADIGPMIRDGRVHNAVTVTALMLAWWNGQLPGAPT